MKLCISLDLPSAKANLELVEQIKEYNVWLKVGLRTYVRDGKQFLQELKNINPNFKIFLDLKLYDIPNTMADTAEEISNFGLVDMFNIHASSGKEAMTTVMQRIQNIKNKPLVLAVTALTSFTNKSFKEIYNENIDIKATKFAQNAYDASVNGVVCSAYESLSIKKHTSKEFITLCPGIRPFGENADDQKRVATIEIAKKNFVDFIVIGRPIYQSENKKEIINKILQTI